MVSFAETTPVDPVVSIVQPRMRGPDRGAHRMHLRLLHGLELHAMPPVVGAGGLGVADLTCIVTGPRQVPVRKEVTPHGRQASIRGSRL